MRRKAKNNAKGAIDAVLEVGNISVLRIEMRTGDGEQVQELLRGSGYRLLSESEAAVLAGISPDIMRMASRIPYRRYDNGEDAKSNGHVSALAVRCMDETVDDASVKVKEEVRKN